jgi:hypothetical protein
MTPLIIFGALVFIPVALTVMFRINGAVLFMSLCVGEVLVQFVAGDAHSLVTAISSAHGNQIADSTIR